MAPALLIAALLNGVIVFLASRTFDTRRPEAERPAQIVMLLPDVLARDRPKPAQPKARDHAHVSGRQAAPLPLPTPERSAPPPAASVGAPQIDPRWRVGDGAFSDPARRANAIAFSKLEDRLRVQRACFGGSGEHLTEEEKAACAAYWSRAR